MISFKEYVLIEGTDDDLKKNASWIRRNKLHIGGWGSFKHHLHRYGFIDTPTSDVPKEWQNAFLKANGRPILKESKEETLDDEPEYVYHTTHTTM